jgi:hypothetical protein
MPEYVDYGSDDGATLGRTSTELISFYGATPVTRYVGAGAASTYIVTTAVTTSAAGLNSAAAMTSLVLQVSTLTVALRNIGLID